MQFFSFPVKYRTISFKIFTVIIGTFLMVPSISFGDENNITHYRTTTANNEKQTQENHTPMLWILSVPFQRIENGSFIMGSPVEESGRDSDEDQQLVEITRSFEIMEREVTQSQWMLVMGRNPSRFQSAEDCDDYENGMCPNHPVDQVSWTDAQTYIMQINDSLQLTGCDGTPNSKAGCYRLPTEAEWEYATRASTTTTYSFGDDPSDLEDFAWYIDNSKGRTHKVGIKNPNPIGLYDVHGNVWEWVQDNYVKNLPGGTDPLNNFYRYLFMRNRNLKISAKYLHVTLQNITPIRLLSTIEDPEKTDPLNQAHLLRVIRGGSFNIQAHGLRSAYRGLIYQGLRFHDIGFRLVRTL